MDGGKKIIKRLSDIFKKYAGGGNKKRLVENTIIVVIVGIIILIAGGTLFKKSEGSKKVITEEFKKEEQKAEETVVSNNANDNIEGKMKSILSKIDGAGEVDVMITYVSGVEIVPAVDIKKNDSSTQEKDTGGGTRNVEQHDYQSNIVYYEERDGDKRPVVIKDLQPVIKGVVVVAKGGDKPEVKERLTRAVQALMDIPVHRIQVFKSK